MRALAAEQRVEHGAAVTRDRLQAFLPADMLLSENAHARGFRLDGYGMFFDVSVPDLEGTVQVARGHQDVGETALGERPDVVEPGGVGDGEGLAAVPDRVLGPAPDQARLIHALGKELAR